MRNSSKLLVATAAAGLVATAGTAFTASSDVPNHKLGQDVGTISGYVTSAVAYTYDNPGTTITDVTFTLDSSASVVKARITTSATVGTYVACAADTDTDAGGPDEAVLNQWHCNVNDVTVADSTGLDVFASEIAI